VIFAAFHAFWWNSAVPLRVGEPLAVVALGGQSTLAWFLHVDGEEADRLQVEDLRLVVWNLNEDEREFFFRGESSHPGDSNGMKSLSFEVFCDLIDRDFHRYSPEYHSNGSFLLEGKGVERHLVPFEESGGRPESVGRRHLDSDPVSTRFGFCEVDPFTGHLRRDLGPFPRIPDDDRGDFCFFRLDRSRDFLWLFWWGDFLGIGLMGSAWLSASAFFFSSLLGNSSTYSSMALS
jgi:hypothetical protein